MKKVIQGLQILIKYDRSETICADHNVIYAATCIENVSEEDKKILDELGWGYDEVAESWRIYL